MKKRTITKNQEAKRKKAVDQQVMKNPHHMKAVASQQAATSAALMPINLKKRVRSMMKNGKMKARLQINDVLLSKL